MVKSTSSECRVLFEMFSTPRGKVSLGRVDAGADAGRIALLRELPESPSPLLESAVEVSKGFTHPQLLKLLGVRSDETRSYIASEYLPGVSLFELIARARARQTAFEVGAAVRILSDALVLVRRLESLLREAGRPRVRLLFTDCIWIADYGETLLYEPGIGAYLASRGPEHEVEQGAHAIERDVMSAAVELFQLATAKLMMGDLAQAVEQHLPEPLARALRASFLTAAVSPAESIPSLIEGLAGLPRELIGTEAQVGAELQRVAPDLLEERKRRLADLVGGGPPELDAHTRVYMVGAAAEIDPDEVTVEVRKAFRGRPVPSRLPRELQPYSPPAPASPASRARKAVSSAPGPTFSPKVRAPLRQVRAPLRRRRAALLWGLLLLAIALMGMAAWRQPAWLRGVAARLHVGRY